MGSLIHRVCCMILLLLGQLGCGSSSEQFESEAPSTATAPSDNGAPPANGTEKKMSGNGEQRDSGRIESANSSGDAKRDPSASPDESSSTPGTLAAGTLSTAATALVNLLRVEVRFEDASIPPEYHRSYTIAVEKGKVSARVDVYGEVIATGEGAVSRADWDTLKTSVPVKAIAGGEDDGAAGTSVYSVRIWRVHGPVRELSWTSLTPDSPELRAALAFVARIEALVPNLQALRDTEYSP